MGKRQEGGTTVTEATTVRRSRLPKRLIKLSELLGNNHTGDDRQICGLFSSDMKIDQRVLATTPEGVRELLGSRNRLGVVVKDLHNTMIFQCSFNSHISVSVQKIDSDVQADCFIPRSDHTTLIDNIMGQVVMRCKSLVNVLKETDRGKGPDEKVFAKLTTTITVKTTAVT
jgi:hypothetical protein